MQEPHPVHSSKSMHRLVAAVAKAIPLVVVPGALDVAIFTESTGVPAAYRDPARKFIVHSPTNTCGRTTQEELLEAGRYIVSQLNKTQGTAAVLLPLEGIDAYNSAGGQWPEMEPVEALYEELRGTLNQAVELHEVPAHINDRAFADKTVEVFLKLWEKCERGEGAIRA